MRYPKLWKKVVDALGLASGSLTLVIALLSVFEAVSRYCFNHPSSWSLSISCYVLVYIVYFASPYAFQEGGHVAVDMVKLACDKINPTGKLRKAISVIGFVFALGFMYVLGKGSWTLMTKAIASHKATLTIPVIPLWVLYAPMVVGIVLMSITLIFMILDCIAKDGTGRYL